MTSISVSKSSPIHIVIFSLAVDHAYRGKGISRQLMKAFIHRTGEIKKTSRAQS